MNFVSVVLAEAEHVQLPIPIWAYALVAVVAFIALAAVVWSFRDVANRHSAKADAYAAAHGGGTGHGH